MTDLGYLLENVDLGGELVPESCSLQVSGQSLRISADKSLPGKWSKLTREPHSWCKQNMNSFLDEAADLDKDLITLELECRME